MRDRASVNNVAMRTIKVLYPYMLDVGCFSHTIDHVGKHLNTPVLSPFVSNWVKVFSHSPRARLLWKQQTGRSMTTYSATCWWSKWEVMKQLLVQFGDISLFLTSDEDFAPTLRAKLLAVLENPQQKMLLKLELAATVDAGELFVKATYRLEGDGPLALEFFEVITMLQASISNNHHPNVTAIVRHLPSGNSVAMNQMEQYALGCIQPAVLHHPVGNQPESASSCFQGSKALEPSKGC